MKPAVGNSTRICCPAPEVPAPVVGVILKLFVERPAIFETARESVLGIEPLIAIDAFSIILIRNILFFSNNIFFVAN